jgi:hypothetical protein
MPRGVNHVKFAVVLRQGTQIVARPNYPGKDVGVIEEFYQVETPNVLDLTHESVSRDPPADVAFVDSFAEATIIRKSH